MTSTPLALPSGAPPPAPPRITHRAAALVASVAGAMVFAGFIAAYLAVRAARGDFPPRGLEYDYYTATTLMVTLLLSAVTIEWAAHAVRNELRGQGAAALAITLGLAVAYLNGLSYLIHGLKFRPGDHFYGTLVHAMMVASLVNFFVGFAALVITTLRHIGRQLTLENYDILRATAIYWHFVTLAWIAVYYVVYVTK